MYTRLSHLKVKIKTLAAEARIIRHEELMAGPRLKFSLREHRTGIVRSAARHNLLAYGFLRGVPYVAMEAYASAPPDWDVVWKTAHRFGLVYYADQETAAEYKAREEALLQSWKLWSDTAKQFLTLAA